MMMDSYDVVVIGAGPAGLFAAKSAMENGASVLLIERNRAIGVPVQCAEGLHPSIVQAFEVPLNTGWINGSIKHISIHSPGGKKAILQMQGGLDKPFLLIIERKMFQKEAAVWLAKRGCHVLTDAKATGLLKDGNQVNGVRFCHLGEEKQVKAKVVIAADGPASKTAGWAGIEVPKNTSRQDTGVQFQMAGIDTKGDHMEIFFSDLTPGGYAWIFPKADGFANVGLALKPGEKGSAMARLKEFVANDPRLAKGSIVEVNAGPVPTGGYLEKAYGNGILVIGDAALMVNPFTGGGLAFASPAGRIAGRIAAEAVKEGNVTESALSQFQKEFDKKFLKLFKRSYGIKKIMYELPTEKLDSMFDDIGTISIPDKYKTLEETRGYILRKLFKALIKNAGMILKVRKAMKEYDIKDD